MAEARITVAAWNALTANPAKLAWFRRVPSGVRLGQPRWVYPDGWAAPLKPPPPGQETVTAPEGATHGVWEDAALTPEDAALVVLVADAADDDLLVGTGDQAAPCGPRQLRRRFADQIAALLPPPIGQEPPPPPPPPPTRPANPWERSSDDDPAKVGKLRRPGGGRPQARP